MKERWHFTLSGRVQAVGLRYRAQMLAKNFRLTGWVANLENGDVALELQGEPEEISRYLTELRSQRGIRLDSVQAEEIPTVHELRFKIRQDEWGF